MNQQLPGMTVSQLEEAYTKLDGELDHMSWRNEVGLDVDMVKWYATIDKMEGIQRQIAELRYRNEVDPFEPCDPPADDREYDPAEEWNYTTSYMRKGE